MSCLKAHYTALPLPYSLPCISSFPLSPNHHYDNLHSQEYFKHLVDFCPMPRCHTSTLHSSSPRACCFLTCIVQLADWHISLCIWILHGLCHCIPIFPPFLSWPHCPLDKSSLCSTAIRSSLKHHLLLTQLKAVVVIVANSMPDISLQHNNTLCTQMCQAKHKHG